MSQIKKFRYKIYYNFLNNLAKELTRFYNVKLGKSFKVSNKLNGRGYDPVTSSDKAFEKFIRSKIECICEISNFLQISDKLIAFPSVP